MKKYIRLIVLVSFFIAFIIFPQEYITAAKEGIEVCLYTIIPSLLPFFVISSLIISSNLMNPISEKLTPVTKKILGLNGHIVFVYLTSALSGYPMGAKLTVELNQTKQISDVQSENLLFLLL